MNGFYVDELWFIPSLKEKMFYAEHPYVSFLLNGSGSNSETLKKGDDIKVSFDGQETVPDKIKYNTVSIWQYGYNVFSTKEEAIQRKTIMKERLIKSYEKKIREIEGIDVNE